MITLDDYFHHADWYNERTAQVDANAAVTVDLANALLDRFGQHRAVTSGWRPTAVNRNTPGAAQNSKHLTGQAVDLADPEGDLDEWCYTAQDLLAEIGLWQEHPASTKGWCHIQTVPPKSGNRVFYP